MKTRGVKTTGVKTRGVKTTGVKTLWLSQRPPLFSKTGWTNSASSMPSSPLPSGAHSQPRHHTNCSTSVVIALEYMVPQVAQDDNNDDYDMTDVRRCPTMTDYMYERVKSSTFGISHVIRQNVKCSSFTRVGSSLF